LYSLALKFQVDSKVAQERASLVVSLFKVVTNHLNLSPLWLKRLNVAAWLCESGKMINPLSYSKHSQYLIAHSMLSDLSQEDILLVSLLARYHRREPKKSDTKLSFLDEPVRKEFLSVASLLRFVCQAEQLTMLDRIDVSSKADGLILKMNSADIPNVSSAWDSFGRSLKLKAQFRSQPGQH
jgi:exopolyphosphatase / guanosine-5'-triphosphate,3'-diphosphate pyrophosphatase